MTPARQFFAVLLAFSTLIAGCGGSVGPSPVVVDPLTITVQPASAVIYPGVATTLVITGGTGSYSVVSDNQAVVPIVSPATGHSLTVIANPVSADTVVNLSVRDTGTAPQKTVVLTVRPGTIANSVTITPATAECAPAVCTGQEALVTATISQAGIPLPARGVRFDVVSGDVRFITTPVNTTPEVLATTLLTTSDLNGQVRVRLRVLPNVPDQTALIQITDPETQAFQRIAITVRQFTGAGNASFFSIPQAISFAGPRVGQCASSGTATFTIFGGTPPYTVSNSSSSVTLLQTTVSASGGSFSARLNSSACFTDLPIPITDAAGRTITVRISSVEGTVETPPVTVQPPTLSLACGGGSSATIAGGTAPFSAASGHPRVVVALNGRVVTATRLTPDAAPNPGPFPTTGSIAVTDGNTGASVALTVPATCP